MKRSIFCFALILVTTVTSFASSPGKVKKYIDKGFYDQALELAEAMEADGDGSPELSYYKGIALLKLYRQEEALQSLESAGIGVDPEAPYYLSLAYLENHQHEKAVEALAKLKKDALREEIITRMNNQLSSFDGFFDNQEEVVVQNLGPQINDLGHEYSGIMTKDQQSVVYTVRHKGADGLATDGMAYEEVYQTTMDDAGQWQAPKKFRTHSGRRHHDATVQLFADDTKMITYRDEDLFISTQKDGKWSSPVPVTEVNALGSAETHCFFNDAMDTVFFATNYFSDNGDLDLYMRAKGPNGNWMDPQELKELNTPFNDDAPFMAGDGTLYFSSKGHNSMGGYDVFKSQYDKASGKWKQPVNLGFPINSPSDDTYFNAFGKVAYISSGRAGGYGNMDIYRIFLFNKVRVVGQVVDDETLQALSGAKLTVTVGDEQYSVVTDQLGRYDLLLPIETMFGLTVTYMGKEIFSHEQQVKVLLRDQTDNVFHFKVNLEGDDAVMPPSEIPVAMKNDYQTDPGSMGPENDMEMLTMKVHHEDVVKVQKKESPKPSVLDIRPPVVYFGFDDYQLKEDAKDTLIAFAKKLKAFSGFKLAIAGHTDLVGQKSYNQKLALKRAKKVMEYLQQMGMTADMETSTYGEEQPAIQTEDEKAANRRVEIRIMTVDQTTRTETVVTN
ncbi:OmpA family protein [Marinoscillum furvescens]|uniref:Outer membrane protein OmpA-like peptidoglycan-associated protein n=1 Tax=Marinoscillum furvescens DSM 4134 TaxID=1122208 RepID=A0A3D9L101_MARFU|nr:OmpA family protein [Marinoscillum furvescens]RED96980.1 outer membrane protein OmpA-like peptidoglycan-associated protein [Marinoscillum furvescens DSM 4134]